MGILGYIKAKKTAFQVHRETALARRAQEAEVRLYKAEIESAQLQKIEESKRAEEKVKALRSRDGVRGIANKYMNTVATNNKKNIGRPSLFANNNLQGDFKGPFAQDAKKKEKGWDPVGDYKGPFGK